MPTPSPLRAPETPELRLTIDLPLGVGDAIELIEEVAEQWGGELERGDSGGRLALPASAGLRHGLIEGEVSLSRLGAHGSRVDLRIDQERYRLQVSAVVVLLIGAAGGLFLILAPLFLGPASLRLLPAAFFVMLAAWFLVASRVRHRGGAEFVAELAAATKSDESPR